MTGVQTCALPISTAEAIFQKTLKDTPKIQEIYNNLKPGAQRDLRNALILGHELGHALAYRVAHSYFASPKEFTQLIKHYENWAKKKPEFKEQAKQANYLFPEQILGEARLIDGPLSFSEFFATQVARKLVYSGKEKQRFVKSELTEEDRKFDRGFASLKQERTSLGRAETDTPEIGSDGQPQRRL